MKKTLKIGGASGYWGESSMATPQLLSVKGLDYLVYDYLAEITMSILARAKAKNSDKGYATDFINAVMRPHLKEIAAKKVKVISNAGGVNPLACGQLLRALIKEQNLDLKVAIITGDNLVENVDLINASNPVDMFSGASFPPKEKIASINAYLGAFPIAKALAAGADIVITGRVVDSAVTLGACIHEFGWETTDWNVLSSGSLAGHILECGPQATGGNFTDWEDVPEIENIGYPVVEISADGSFNVTKPNDTGGLVSMATVAEQMLYEIGDPQSYILPDVICDFSQVKIKAINDSCVNVKGALGRPAPHAYKTCLTYMDGFRAGTYMSLYGLDAVKKAEKLSKATFDRANKYLRESNLGDFTQTSQEIIGAGSQMGTVNDSREVVLKIAVQHPDIRGVGLFLKEAAGMGLATPPGLSGFTGVRGKPSPVVRLFSYLTPKTDIEITIDVENELSFHRDKPAPKEETFPTQHTPPFVAGGTISVPLIKLAWGRSGDKGNKANIGLIARKPEYLPYIWQSLSEERLAEIYAHFIEGTPDINKFYLPGTHAMNILIDNILGGGGAASLRNDAQGKGYAQILLAHSVKISPDLVET